MAKAKEPQKLSKKLGGGAKSRSETPVSSKANPAPAKSKTGNTKETRPTPKAAKAAVKSPAQPTPAKPSASAKPASQGDSIPKTTGATGRDHPSQNEHMHRLYEKLHGASAQRAGGPPSGSPGGKKGFDPNQFRGGKGNFAGGHSQMIRRTQGRGGGSGGGGGGGGSGA